MRDLGVEKGEAFGSSILFADWEDETSEYISHISPKILAKIKDIEYYDKRTHIANLSLSLPELKVAINLFLNESQWILNTEKSLNNITIDFFIPEHLLYSKDFDIDKWDFFDLYQTKIYPIGAKFNVLLHYLGRFIITEREKRKDKKNAIVKKLVQDKPWKVNWNLVIKRYQDSPTSDDFPIISQPIYLENKLGVVLEKPFQRDKFLKSIIEDDGIPIVIWTRYDSSEVNHCVEIQEKLVCAGRVIDLPNRVFTRRKQAHRENRLREDLGYHLVLLWDDANCFLPSTVQNPKWKFPTLS